MEKSDLRFNRWAAILAGAFLLAAAAVYLFWPEELLLRYNFVFYPTIFANETIFRLPYIFMALSALLAIGMVLGVRDLLKSERSLLRWVTLLAVISLAVTGVDFISQQEVFSNQAENYVYLQSRYDGYGYFLYRTPQGEFLLSPYPGGPMESAGVKHGDVVLQVDGKTVTGRGYLDVWNQMTSTGDSLRVQVQSPGEEPREISVMRSEVNYWDINAQRALDQTGAPMLDPTYLFGFGIMGLWLVVVCWRGLAENAFPRWLAYLGFLVALAYWLFVAGFMFNIYILNYVARVAGLTLGPAWYIWMGIVLGRQAKE